jgi:membrane associated rhomboid family serine protease
MCHIVAKMSFTMENRDPRLNRPETSQPANSGPAINAPIVVIVLCVLIVLAHLAALGTFGGQDYAPAVALWLGAVRTGAAAAELPPAPIFGLTPYVLHVFLHFGWFHLLVNLGVLLAVGSQTARAFGTGVRATVGFLLFFFACAIGGAVVSVLVNYDSPSVMAGASTAVSGLVASAGWTMGGRAGMLRLAIPWLVINLGLGVAELFIDQPIAWAGHIGGLLVGMLAFPFFLAAFRRRPDSPRRHRPF